MKKDVLQQAYKSKLDQIKGLEATIGEGMPTAEQTATYETLLGEAKSLAKNIDLANMSGDLKSFGDESAGSVVKSGFSREALPGEGEIPGVTVDAKTGEMHAVAGEFKSMGQKKPDKIVTGKLQ